MNEQEQADLLAQQLDALLADESLPETPPEAIAGLLPVARDLAQAAPNPRPKFGPALKESLLASTSGQGGAAGSAAAFLNGQILLILALVLVTLAVIAALVGTALVFGLTGSAIFGSASATPSPAQTQLPAAASPSPPPPPTATTEPTARHQATDSLPSPSVTATATEIIDLLPPVAVTPDAGEGPPTLQPLAPGQNDDQGGDSDYGGSSGGGGGQGDDDDG